MVADFLGEGSTFSFFRSSVELGVGEAIWLVESPRSSFPFSSGSHSLLLFHLNRLSSLCVLPRRRFLVGGGSDDSSSWWTKGALHSSKDEFKQSWARKGSSVSCNSYPTKRVVPRPPSLDPWSWRQDNALPPSRQFEVLGSTKIEGFPPTGKPRTDKQPYSYVMQFVQTLPASVQLAREYALLQNYETSLVLWAKTFVQLDQYVFLQLNIFHSN